MIPCDTVITDEQFLQLDGIIKKRQDLLRKCKNGEIDRSLWLMFEIAHLQDLKEFNSKKKDSKCRCSNLKKSGRLLR